MRRMQMRPLIVSVCAGLCAAAVFVAVYPSGSDAPTLVEESDTTFRGPWKQATATVFWVGEDETTDNGFIHNRASAWDPDWEASFGGVDTPEERCGYHPCAFTPNENPFYIALPYNDMRNRGTRKNNTHLIPWNDSDATSTLLKDRWVEVKVGPRSCFGQWEDVGPFETNDIEYVFGDAAWPANETGTGAGIDLSPAMRDCLSLGDVAEVEWRHVDAAAVPRGPWTEIVTGSRQERPVL